MRLALSLSLFLVVGVFVPTGVAIAQPDRTPRIPIGTRIPVWEEQPSASQRESVAVLYAFADFLQACELADGQEGARRGDGVPAHQPPARLPDLRPGRRVRPAGPGDGLRRRFTRFDENKRAIDDASTRTSAPVERTRYISGPLVEDLLG
jgi:hypothetical protein